MSETSTALRGIAADLRCHGMNDLANALEMEAIKVRRMERTLDEIVNDSLEDMERMDAEAARAKPLTLIAGDGA